MDGLVFCQVVAGRMSVSSLPRPGLDRRPFVYHSPIGVPLYGQPGRSSRGSDPPEWHCVCARCASCTAPTVVLPFTILSQHVRHGCGRFRVKWVLGFQYTRQRHNTDKQSLDRHARLRDSFILLEILESLSPLASVQPQRGHYKKAIVTIDH